jgi:hypothetical protein
MEEGASATKLHFGDRDMERQDISSQGMSKCRNAEMRKTPFGVGFGYRELECRNTSPQGMSKCFGVGFEMRNVKKCEKHLLV